MVEKRNFVFRKEAGPSKSEIESEIDALVMRYLVEEGLEITLENMRAYKRRAEDRYLMTRTKDGRLSGGLEADIIRSLALREAFRHGKKDE